MASREEIAQIIGYMKLVFPNYNPDITSHPNTIDVFEDLLGDMKSETLQSAVKAACKESDRAFAPSAGEIRGAAMRMMSIQEIQQERIAKSFERLEEDTKSLEAKNAHQTIR
jgi:hypothetical protein